ncbi:MAG: RNA-binding protein [Deltaproteobacteria bacterium]|nr:RNA-binding protein [Deltaproteobacteria bacterium]
MKILARNLSRKTTEEELKALFEPYGEVSSHNLVYDNERGTSKGFGFVEMPNSREALTAIKKLNNQNVGGCRIRVKMAKQKGSKAPHDD